METSTAGTFLVLVTGLGALLVGIVLAMVVCGILYCALLLAGSILSAILSFIGGGE